MLEFAGGILTVTQNQVTGLARVTRAGEALLPTLALRFETLGTFMDAQVRPLGDGFWHFTFDLAESFRAISWASFLNEFLGVVAFGPTGDGFTPWIIPLYKNVLAGLDNGTALNVERPREYALKPVPNGRIAVFTIVYNEHTLLPLWISYYARQFGAENLYVIDHGSTRPYENLPPGVTVIRLPRDEFDNWLIARTVALFQRVLLETYDSVLYADSDEFVCVAPDALAGQSMAQFLLAIPQPIAITRGYNLHHDVRTEIAYDPARPVLSQRRIMKRATSMDKPLVSRVPLSWIPGFHRAYEGGVKIPGLFMLHLRWFDLDTALVKGGHYRSSKWHPHDVAYGLASNQRDSDDKITAEFRERSETFAGMQDADFDFDASLTVVPNWMQEQIFV